MTALKSKLLREGNRPALISACEQLIEDEVKSKSGLSGLAIKTGFKTVKTIRTDIIHDLVDVLLDDFVDSLEDIYGAYVGGQAQNIESYVTSHADAVADALLGITDRRAEKSTHGVLIKAYKTLRPQGKKQVIKAMPRIGSMLNSQGL